MKEDFFVDETEIVKVLEKIEQCDNSSFARYISDEGLNLCDEAVLRNAFFNYSIQSCVYSLEIQTTLSACVLIFS